MIVRSVENGWEIVFQSAHALLAGQLATHLKGVTKRPYWSETLAAILDHDDHKESFGNNVYLTELGAPKDFTQFRFTARERFEEVLRRVDSGYRKHRWIGLLAARHAEELYRSQKVSKKLDQLLAAERHKRPSVLAELSATADELEAAYAVLRWCDRTSLILCQHELPTMQRRIEIASLGDGKRYEIWERKNGVLSVEPWPFDMARFKVHVEVRTTSQLTYRTDRELESCLRDCKLEDRYWEFGKDPQT